MQEGELIAYSDIRTYLYTLLGTITIPPTGGEPAISKNVVDGWPDIAALKESNGQLRPTYSIVRSTLVPKSLDNVGQAETYLDTIQVDCWCTNLANEPANDLMERMLEQLRAVIKANNLHPTNSAYFMRIGPETPRDEPEQSPSLKRTMVLLYVYGMR